MIILRDRAPTAAEHRKLVTSYLLALAGLPLPVTPIMAIALKAAPPA